MRSSLMSKKFKSPFKFKVKRMSQLIYTEDKALFFNVENLKFGNKKFYLHLFTLK